MASNEHATGVNAIIRQQQALVEDEDLRAELGLSDAGPDQEPPADAVATDGGRLSGTLICLDEGPESATWHWSVSFNGRTHGTHCGEEADARDNVLAVELEPAQAWRKDTLAGEWCEECGAAIHDAADEAVDRGEGIATDGGMNGLDLRLLDVTPEDDDEAREIANVVYNALQNAGYDPVGVAPVIVEEADAP
jgi:hypothetical protein